MNEEVAYAEGTRTFNTGATRDSDEHKPDYEGFLSPLVIQRYGEYMHGCRRQTDGKLRESDNWQKGIPRAQYMKSLWRHFMESWAMHRGYGSPSAWLIEQALCGIMFNAMGYLHEHLKEDLERRVEIWQVNLSKVSTSSQTESDSALTAADTSQA